MTDTTLVEQEIEIEAPAVLVFDLLTDASGLLEWIAVEAESDLVVGGRIRWRHHNGAVVSGRYVEIDPPNRLAFTYGWEEGGPALAPESSLVEIDLEERDGVTRLRLTHRHLPRPVADGHAEGWAWFLKKLAECSVAGTTAQSP